MNYTASQVRRLMREHAKKPLSPIWEPIIDEMVKILKEKKMITLVDKVLAAWDDDDSRWGGMPEDQAEIAIKLVLEEAVEAILKTLPRRVADRGGLDREAAAILALGDKP